MLRGIDRAAFAVAFADRLRHAGVPAGLTDVEDFARALAASPPVAMSTLYWTARISLVRQRAHLAAFDRVFAAVFADAPPLPLTRSAAPPGRRDEVHVPVPADTDDAGPGGGLPWATLPPAVAEAREAETALRLPERRPGALAVLADGRSRSSTARRSRCSATPCARPSPAGRPGAPGGKPRPGRTAGRSAADDRPGPPYRVGTRGARPRRPVRRPRRVVHALRRQRVDAAQATAYLHLMRAFAVVADAEVFAFATTLTRLTAVLRHTSAAAAVAHDQRGRDRPVRRHPDRHEPACPARVAPR